MAELGPIAVEVLGFTPLIAHIEQLVERVRELEEWASSVTIHLNRAMIPVASPAGCAGPKCRCTPDS